MMDCLNYEIIDFGAGRKLERFGDFVLDRPSPPAEGVAPRLATRAWERANAAFFRNSGLKGRWEVDDMFDRRGDDWAFETSFFRLKLKPTQVGHLGVFPEQFENWRWLYESTLRCLEGSDSFHVLNLFAYTGGSSLAVAKAFEEFGILPEMRERFAIAHVDSARNIVQWARENALFSARERVPIRWIAEDAMKFVQREVRRGRRYNGIILDPPTYGHGVKGEVWKLDDHLEALLTLCAQLSQGGLRYLLLTTHSPGWDCAALERIVRQIFPRTGHFRSFSMSLSTKDGRKLPSGEGIRVFFD
ncbi:MAG: class I SAM-dependent methyltransferase [Planctomycetia bacterium]|nr:class I SAM-dependent methyltransferase [Planctomycetia bacterium]